MTSPIEKKRASWIHGPSARCEQVPDGGSAPWRLVLLGAPGVGKGTQADLIARRLGACHLSTGDVFRSAASSNACEQSPAMKEALLFMGRGELVPDSTVWEMIRARKACLHCKGGFVLDGFPRTVSQAESLQRFLLLEGLDLTAVLNYELPASEIVARLSGRRTCEKCNAVYHVTQRPPQQGGKCDRCDGKLFQREDDRPESIQVRLEAYERSTAPLIDFYRKQGLLVSLEAVGAPDEIYERTVPQIDKRRLSGFAQRLWRAEENRRDT